MKKYLEIKQTKAYTFTNLVGNVGGYIGLFLGYTILNAPKLASKLYHTAQKMFVIRKSETDNVSKDPQNEIEARVV